MGPNPTLELKIEVAQLSDPGRDPNKQVNEDSCGYARTKFGHLCVLCDGMGGHYGGQEASRRAIKTIFEYIEQATTSVPAQALKEAVELAGRRVYELGGPPENKVRPGSTVVAMLLHDGGADVAHVGDSRAYIIRSGQIYPLTRDHSMVQAMIDAGFLTEEQAIGHPDANKITRALGMKPDVEVELRPEPMELFAGDVLLTSSDGLTDLAVHKDILGATKQALASGGLEHGCEQLVRLANDRGGHDNITVQLIRIAQTGAKKTRSGVSETLAQGAAPATTVPDLPPAAAAMAVAPAASHPQQPPPAQHAQHAPYLHAPQQAPQLQQAAQLQQAPQLQHPHAAPQAPASAPGQPLAGPMPIASGPGLLPPMAADTQLRAHLETIPMQPAPTAHDGTSRSSQASVGGALPLPPSPGAGGVTQALGAALATPQPGIVGYRMDGVGGLQRPPASVRYGSPQPPGVGPTPTMTPSPPPGALYGGSTSYAGVPSSVPRGHGGSILFLVLAVSFVIAIVIMAIVWAVFLR